MIRRRRWRWRWERRMRIIRRWIRCEEGMGTGKVWNTFSFVFFLFIPHYSCHNNILFHKKHPFGCFIYCWIANDYIPIPAYNHYWLHCTSQQCSVIAGTLADRYYISIIHMDTVGSSRSRRGSLHKHIPGGVQLRVSDISYAMLCPFLTARRSRASHDDLPPSESR